jgi:hypothetical protein
MSANKIRNRPLLIVKRWSDSTDQTFSSRSSADRILIPFPIVLTAICRPAMADRLSHSSYRQIGKSSGDE